MKGISFLTNGKNERIAVQIDYSLFKNHEQEIEDILDVIIAEERQKEESMPFEKVASKLKKKSK
jgi:hypothetical protein